MPQPTTFREGRCWINVGNVARNRRDSALEPPECREDYLCDSAGRASATRSNRLLSSVLRLPAYFFTCQSIRKLLMKSRLLFLSAVLLLTLVFAAACGSSPDSDVSVAKVTPSETIFTLDSLLAAGFKKGKTFDVEGLTAATDAYYGF